MLLSAFRLSIRLFRDRNQLISVSSFFGIVLIPRFSSFFSIVFVALCAKFLQDCAEIPSHHEAGEYFVVHNVEHGSVADLGFSCEPISCAQCGVSGKFVYNTF